MSDQLVESIESLLADNAGLFAAHALLPEGDAFLKLIATVTEDLGWENTSIRMTVNGVTELDACGARALVMMVLTALKLRLIEDAFEEDQ